MPLDVKDSAHLWDMLDAVRAIAFMSSTGIAMPVSIGRRDSFT